MSESALETMRFRARVTTVVALAIGVLIGVFAKDIIRKAGESIKGADGAAKDYEVQELEVNYLQMLDGVKGVSFDVVNGIKCICECDDAHPEGDKVVYRFQGYIGDEGSRKVQKLQFDYTVKPFVKSGQLSFSGGEVSQPLLEPEDVIVSCAGMKRLVEAFAVPQLKPLELYAPDGAFDIKELYSNMAVIKVSKEK